MDVEAISEKIEAAVAGVVVVHDDGEPPQPPDGHEATTRAAIARELAALKGLAFAGPYDAGFRYPGSVYHVPRDTVIGVDAARSLGIASDDDLFGGVAPHAFVCTKTISHPLVDRDARAPEGWSHAFSEAVAGDVLAGYAAFDADDAIRAGLRLLALGPVRVKRALGIGGRGQEVVRDEAALRRAVHDVDAGELARCGVALEQDLTDVVTYSVGQVRVGTLLASYYGTQRQTRNNAGQEVYGGSELVVVRGDFDVLLALEAPAPVRLAIGQARRYHAAAMASYPGLILSRRNYDVAQGRDAAGRVRSGVLEQSWRLGGASGAEVGALAAFKRKPSLLAVRATTVERYGAFDAVPPHATIHFRDVDPRVGPLTKYVLVAPHVDPR